MARPLGSRTAIHRIPKEVARLIHVGRTNVDIAKELGVAHTTIARWRENPAVREAVTRLERQADREYLDSRQLVQAAVLRNLLDILQDEQQPGTSRVKAASELKKMFGLDAPVKVEATPAAIGPEQMAAMLAQLPPAQRHMLVQEAERLAEPDNVLTIETRRAE